MAKETGFLPNSLVKYITCLLDKGSHYHLWKITRCSFKHFSRVYLVLAQKVYFLFYFMYMVKIVIIITYLDKLHITVFA